MGTDRSSRRAYLPRIRYFVYFDIHEDEVEILGIWHGNRQPPPWAP